VDWDGRHHHEAAEDCCRHEVAEDRHHEAVEDCHHYEAVESVDEMADGCRYREAAAAELMDEVGEDCRYREVAGSRSHAVLDRGRGQYHIHGAVTLHQ